MSAPIRFVSSLPTVIAGAALLLALCACEESQPPEATQAPTSQAVATAEPPAPAETAELAPDDAVQEQAEKEPEPWKGPFLAVTRTSAGVYAEPKKSRDHKIAYVEEGGRVPVHPDKVEGEDCSQGWHRVVSGGFICANVGTTNLEDPRVKYIHPPDLEAVLPYRYARNVHNGTPLYRSVPSREQVRKYEPWRFKDEAKPKKPTGDAKTDAQQDKTASSEEAVKTAREREEEARRRAALAAARRAMLGEAAAKKLEEQGADLDAPPPKAAAAKGADAGAPEAEWWQQEDPKLHELKIADLQKGDDVLAMRMLKGFYIAVSRTFQWQGRTWLRSTKGHIAPADRLHITKGSEFHGVELDDTWQLPIGWTYGFQKTKPRFIIDPDSGQLKRKGSVERFQAINLTGKEREINKRTYVETSDGDWLRSSDLRITRPGPPPKDLAPNERWVDVNLSAQTLVLFEGSKPVYATLISSGKRHQDKDKDHSTPTGEWRIETKHIATTMDGDGTAAGDLPYSIEGVPYVMYFHKSYALHGAFWHQNYGVRMSHGCVNLAPLDAKYIFFHTDPPVHEGLHGAWSSEQHPGSRVVLHRED